MKSIIFNIRWLISIDYYYIYYYYMSRKVNHQIPNRTQIEKSNLVQQQASPIQFSINPKQKNGLKDLEKEFGLNLSDFSSQTATEIIYILLNLLEYPSSKLAQEHQKANRLGQFDLKCEKDSESKQVASSDPKKCKDCGLIIQNEQIPVCTSFNSFPNVGIATYLCFQNTKNLIVLLLILGLTYSGYSLYVNITEPSQSISFANYAKKISFASVVQNLTKNSSLYDSMLYQGWIIVGTIIFWWIFLFIAKNNQIKHERMVDDETITASDFSIMFQHVPISYTKDQLQSDLEAYYDQFRKSDQFKQSDQLKPFTIAKFCRAVPFHFLDDESIKEKIAQIQEQMKQTREEIAQLIEQIKSDGKFQKDQSTRKALYSKYQQLRKKKLNAEHQLKQLSRNQNYLNQEGIKTTIFITFKYSQVANLIQRANPKGFSAKMRYYLSCCKTALFFEPSCEDSQSVKVSRAPEPEDIIWQNIGIPDRSVICRKLLTYTITILLLGSSFGIVYGLTILQLSSNNSILSIGISLSITVINIVITIAIRKLTVYESDITKTNLQTSLAIKSIFAQLMNSVLVPTITNLYIQKNIYEVNGLVYDIFYLSITASILPPIFMLIDIPFLIKKISIWYFNCPFQKLAMNQKQINKIFQYSQFQLGVAQIYYIDLLYFVCFYIHVHPSIVLFALIGCGLMYWAQKRSLIFHSKRPTPSSSLLNDAIVQLITFSPCVLSLGSIVWFNIIQQDYHNFTNMTYITHLAAVGFSAFFYLVPFNSVFNALCFIPDEQNLVYDEVKNQLISEYDLLNPVTAEQALKEFVEFEKTIRIDNVLSKKIKETKQVRYNQIKVDKISEKDERNDTVEQLKRQNITRNSYDNNLNLSDENIIFQQKESNYPVSRKTKYANNRKKQQSIIFSKSGGYNMGILKKNELNEDNPYQYLQF